MIIKNIVTIIVRLMLKQEALWATYLTRALGASWRKSGNKGKFEKF